MTPKIVKGSGESLGRQKNILLIQLGDIGDVVLSTPCIRVLRENFPNAKLVVAVRDKAASLLFDCPWIDELIPIGERARVSVLGKILRQVNFFRSLRSHDFDLAIDLRTGTRGAILARLSGASRRLGFFINNEAWWRNQLFTDLIDFDYKPELYVADYLLILLQVYGVEICAEYREPKLEVSADRLTEAKQLLGAISKENHRVVIIQPFSLWRYKEWGKEKYVDLIRWLVREKGVTVVIAGTTDEHDRAAEIVSEGGPGCHNLAGKTNLSLYAAVLKMSDLFIGVDSSGLHIAAAVETPTVSIFGPSAPSSWAPRGAGRHLVVQKAMSCVPCRQKGCDNREVSRCLDNLSVEEVIRAVSRQL